MIFKRKDILKATIGLFVTYVVWLQTCFSVGHYTTSISGRWMREDALIEELETRHDERKKRAFNACANQSAENTLQTMSETLTVNDIPLLDTIIVDDEHEFLYCYVPKVASTSWKTFLALLMKKVNSSNLHSVDVHSLEMFRRLSNYTLPEIQQRLNRYTKFMFARHPLSRILSAYRNKFQTVNYFHSTYGREIVKLYRTNASQESLLKGNDVTFSEFVRYVTDPRPMIENGEYDEHWAPMVDLCLPCKVKYDIIGKYETLNEDVSFVLKKTNIGRRIKFPSLNVSPVNESLLQTYLSQLTSTELKELYHIYADDFKVFGYDFDYV